MLMRKASRLPAEWAEQRTLLGFEKFASIKKVAICTRTRPQ